MIHTEVRPVGQDLKKVVLLDGLSSKIKCHGQKFQIVLLNGLFPQEAHFTPKTKGSYFSVFLQKFYIRFCLTKLSYWTVVLQDGLQFNLLNEYGHQIIVWRAQETSERLLPGIAAIFSAQIRPSICFFRYYKNIFQE